MAALLVLIGLVGVPFIGASGLARIPMPTVVRASLVLGVPGILVWWSVASSEVGDITNPGAAIVPAAVTLGWLLGSAWGSVVRHREKSLD